MSRIDAIDAVILDLLQTCGTLKRTRIAGEVGLSVPSVSERMRKLEERGVITGYHAVVDARRLHIDVMVFIHVVVDGSVSHAAFVKRALKVEEVLEVHATTGEGSHLLKVRTRGLVSLERLLSRIRSWPGVQDTTVSMVQGTHKETRKLPVAPGKLPI